MTFKSPFLNLKGPIFKTFKLLKVLCCAVNGGTHSGCKHRRRGSSSSDSPHVVTHPQTLEEGGRRSRRSRRRQSVPAEAAAGSYITPASMLGRVSRSSSSSKSTTIAELLRGSSVSCSCCHRRGTCYSCSYRDPRRSL